MINGFVEQPCYLDEFACLDFINEGVSMPNNSKFFFQDLGSSFKF